MNNKKTLRRVLSLLLSAGLLTASLAGCTVRPDEETVTRAETGKPTETEKETEAETDPSAKSSTDPVFSFPGGVYAAAQTVTLALPEGVPEGSYITYTRNGNEPTASTAIYKEPISVLSNSECTVIRAAVFSSDGTLLSHIVTETYLKTGTIALRVVSLVTDETNLYSEKTGILSNRDGSGSDWERPVSVEIIEPDGTVLIRQDGGIRLSGAGSRSFDPASLRIVARKSTHFDTTGVRYDGAGKFKAALFPGDTLQAYDRFLLRNGGNDSFYQAKTNFLRMNGMRDAIANNFCAALAEKTGVSIYAQTEIPVVVYLNGEYYGLLNMKEDFDDNLVSAQTGLDKDAITVLKGKKDGKTLWYEIESGADSELTAWTDLCKYAISHALKSDYETAYAKVSAEIDMDNLCWYYASMLYLCNTDWPQNNTMVWRYTGEPCEGIAESDGKWRFVIRDMDLCFALHDAASQGSTTTYTMADTDTFSRILRFYWDGNGYTFDSSTGLYPDTMYFQGLFDFCLRNASFREKFRAACKVLMSEETATMLKNEMTSYADAFRPAVSAHIAYWKSEGKIYSAYTLAAWQSTLADMTDFVRDRPSYFNRYLNSALSHYEKG